jgi:hypothetical protein
MIARGIITLPFSLILSTRYKEYYHPKDMSNII